MGPKETQRGWATFFEEAIRPRLEIIVTLIIDAATILVALLCRGLTLAAYRYGTEGSEVAWHLRALEYVLDYGIVGAATALVVFDLAKRLRTSWQQLVDNRGKPNGNHS